MAASVEDFFASDDDAVARLTQATAVTTEELARSLWALGLGDPPAELRGAPRVLLVHVHAHLHARFWGAFGAGVVATGGPWSPDPVTAELAAADLPDPLERAELEDRLERDGPGAPRRR